MKNKKEKEIEELINKKRIDIKKWVVIGVLLIILLGTLFFSTSIEQLLKLRPNLSKLKYSDVEIHFIDVGQGDAIAIRFPNDQTMLVDSGPVTQKKILLTYLDQVFFKGKKKHFDYVLLTHSDNDHCGNMVAIFDKYSVDVFYRPDIGITGEEGHFSYLSTQTDYKEVIRQASSKHITTKVSKVGDKLLIGGASVTTVAPVINYSSANALSTVLYLEYNGLTSLLCGDAEYEQLKDMLEVTPTLTKIDVLKIGHHGSSNSVVDTSSEEEIAPTLFDKVDVKNVVISVSNYNTYGHPSSETLSALKAVSVTYKDTLLDRTHLTCEEGNIIAMLSTALSFYSIGKTNDYVFVSYWVIVVIVAGVTLILAVIPSKVFKQYKHSKNQKI